jgi:predicted porin
MYVLGLRRVKVYEFKKKKFTIFLNALLISSGVSALELNVYGVGHVSADSVDDGKDKSVYTASNSSRLGFNGSNHIADKLTVLFQFETGLDPTSQGTNDGNDSSAIHTGQIFTKGRPSFVGLQAGFGKLLIGHMETADQWINDYNLFADQVGDAGNLWAGSGLPGRSDNVFYYEAPAMNGFKGAATFMPAEGTTDGASMLFKGDYAKGSLALGAAYISIGKGNFGGGEKHTAVALTGSYQTGKFTLGAGIQTQTDASGIANNNITNISLGGSMKVGDKSKIKAHYVNLNADVTNSNASLFALGFDYVCDSSTTVYAAFAWVNNDDNSKMVANGKGHGDSVAGSQVAGESSTAISIGLVSKFNVSLLK